jgi:signal transduction histidine kinase/DNA-binding response OmpR family regulator
MQIAWENKIKNIFNEVARGSNLNHALALIADQIAEDTEAAACKIWVVKRGDICESCPLAGACPNRQMCMHLAAASGAEIEREYPRIPLAVLKGAMIARGGVADFSNPADTGEKLFGLQRDPANGRRDAFALYPLKGVSGTVGLIGVFNHRPLREEELRKLEGFAPAAVAAIRVAEMQSRCDSLRARLEKESTSASDIQQAARAREAELEDAVAQLTHLVAQLQVERESIFRTNDDLNRKMTDIEEQARQTRERAESLEESQHRNGQAASEIALQLELKRRRADEENMQLNGRIAALEANVGDLNKARESLKRELEERNIEAERFKAMFDASQSELQSLRESLPTLEAQVATLEEESAKLSERNAELEGEQERLGQEKESIVESMSELQRSLRMAEDERTRHEQNRVGLQQRIEQVSDEIERQRAETKRAMSENELLASEIVRLRGEAEEIKATGLTLSEDNSRLSEDNERLAAINAEQASAHETAKERVSELERNAQSLEQQLSDERAESQSRIAELERQIQELSESLNNAQTRNSELEQINLSLDQSRAESLLRGDEMEAEAGRLRSRNSELENEVARLKTSAVELEQENAAMHEANTQLEGAIERFEALTARLEDSALKLRARAEASERARAELEQRSRVLTEQNRRLQIESHGQARFLANMSHELRTPMNAIIGFTSLLLDDRSLELKDRHRNSLERVSRNARDLLELINNVLDLSKIEAGRMDVYSEPADARDLIERAIAVVEPLKENRPVKLSCEADENLPTLRTDRMKLQQVLINLLSNAVKFTQEGEVRVLAERAASGIRISVSDTGAGIAESELPKIFEEFRQAGTSSRQSRSGTGLGLTICRRLVELLGGKISVTSRLGSGTTFIVALPVEIEGRIASTPETEAPLADPHRTALVIDSDPASLYLTKKYLTEAGYSVAATDDAGRGAEIARLAAPAVITINLDLLEGGAQIIEQIARLEQESEDHKRAIIVLSSDASHERIAMESGAKVFLRKPVEREQLVAALERARRDAPGRALVVDDDEDALDLVVAMIEESGYDIKTARDGRGALEEIGRERPDVIILDLMLPEMDGFEVAHRLSLNADWREIPIIMLTARDLSHEERRALDTGFVRIIQKGNFTRDELLAELSLATNKDSRNTPSP